MEQVDFLRKLYRNELPFKVEHQRLVKDIMIVEAGRDWILRAKTGWQARVEPQIGWWGRLADADRGGHLRAEHRSAGRHEGCAETGEAIVRSIPSRSEHFRAETCTGFSWCISPFVNRSPPLRNWMRSSRS